MKAVATLLVRRLATGWPLGQHPVVEPVHLERIRRRKMARGERLCSQFEQDPSGKAVTKVTLADLAAELIEVPALGETIEHQTDHLMPRIRRRRHD
jgi:hypothetical protein